MRLAIIYSFCITVVLAIGCNLAEEKSMLVRQFKQNSIVFDDRVEKMSSKAIKQIFYLVRHAEKDTTTKDNPLLTPKGEERSVALARLFKETRVDELYSTLFMRTLMTVDSLSNLKGIKILPYNHKDLKAFAESLKHKENLRSALIVGHSNSTPTLVSFLADRSSDDFPALDERTYDRLFVVVIHEDGTSKVIELKYHIE